MRRPHEWLCRPALQISFAGAQVPRSASPPPLDSGTTDPTLSPLAAQLKRFGYIVVLAALLAWGFVAVVLSSRGSAHVALPPSGP